MYAGAVLALVLASPAVAHAAAPGCDRMAWNDQQSQGNTNFWDRVRGPETAAFTFDCVVSYGFQGTVSSSGHAKPGIVHHIVSNAQGLSQMLLLLMLVVEFCWVGLFAAEKAAEEMVSGAIRYVLVAVLMANYWSIVNGAKELAVRGSMGTHQFLVGVTQSTTGTGFASQRAIRDQVRMQLAEREALKRRQSNPPTPADTLTADERVKLAKLNDVLDQKKCYAAVPTNDPVRMQEARLGCDMIGREESTIRSAFDRLQGLVGAALDPFETIRAWVAKGMVFVVASAIEFVLSALMVAVFSLVALSFLMICAIGPFVLPFMGFRRAKGVGTWWFKNLFACAILPIVMAAAVALYSSTIDYIIWETDNTSPMMILLGPCIAFPLMVMAMKGGFSMLQQFGGGMAFAGIELGKQGAKIGLAVATGGLAGAGTAAASGGGIGARIAGAARGMGGAMRDATAQTAGTMFQGTDRKPSEGTARAIQTLASKRGMQELAGKTRALTGTATNFDKPTGTVSELERQHAHARAGADLASQLEPGKDFSAGANGAISLSASGRQKVKAYREANRDALRSMTQYGSEDEFVNGTAANGAGVAAMLRGGRERTAHQQGIDQALGGGHNGGIERTFIEQLHPSLTARSSPAEKDGDYANRLLSLAGTVRRKAGGSWSGAQQVLARMNSLAARQVDVMEEDEGNPGRPLRQSYGVVTESITGDESQVRYRGQAGSAWAHEVSMRPGVSHAKLYSALSKQAMRNPENQRTPNESDEAYQRRIDNAIFLNQAKRAAHARATS